MAGSVIVAQATGPQGPNSPPPKTVTVIKPDGNQAITIHLDGATKLDLSAIANENITLVHVGDRLIILFDNHAEVTIEPFYSDNGQPLPDITVELGPDHDVTASQFASEFPITTDQSVLPASGGPNSVSSGADFVSFTIDTFTPSGSALPFLGSEPANGPANGETNQIVPPSESPPSLNGATLTATVFEGGLVTDAFNPAGGNAPGTAVTATGVAGSLNALVNFGSAGPGANPFQFVSPAAANAWLASLGLTSHGGAIDTATITGNTLVASTDPGQASPHQVFSLTINSDGSVTFTLLAPLDDGPNQNETSTTIDLSGLIEAVSGSGQTITLSKDVTVTVTDDAPVDTSALEEGPVFEGGLRDAAHGGTDPFGNGTDSSQISVGEGAGFLNLLVAFGADGPSATPFGFTVANNSALNLGITSHGAAVDFATVTTSASGETLTAYTGGSASGTEVFTLTVGNDGSWNFKLFAPLDDGPNQGENGTTLDLSSLVKGIDFDGNAIALAANALQVLVQDDAPATVAGASVSGLVTDAGLDPGSHAATTTGGVAGQLDTLVHFGADGPSATAPFQFLSDANGALTVALTNLNMFSAGAIVATAIVTTTATGSTLLAEDPFGDQVFSLTLNHDGSWNFQLLGPVDVSGGFSQKFDLSSLVQAVDFDGSLATLAANELEITVTADAPKVNPVAMDLTGTVNEDGLFNIADTADGGTDPYGTGSESTLKPPPATSFNGQIGDLNQLVIFGASGPAFVPFQFTVGDQTQILAGNTSSGAINLNGLTSHGLPVNFATVELSAGGGELLTAYAGGNASGAPVFTLQIDSNGLWTFTLLSPLDNGPNQHENGNTIDLSGLIQAVDTDGSSLTLPTGDLVVTITDDTPVLATPAPAGFAATVNEGGLTAATDPYGTGNEPASATTSGGVAGELNSFVSGFGADGPNATPFQFVATASTVLAGLGIESHGSAVNFASVTTDATGTTLAAYTGGSTSGTEVFTLRLDDDGSWNVTLLAPIDHNGPQTFDLSGLVEAVDFDGSAVTLAAGSIDVTITDDTPMLTGSVVGSVDEGGLTAATDPFGIGNDPGAATASGGSLGIAFGADGAAAVNAVSFADTVNAFNNVSATDANHAPVTLTSHGVALEFALIDAQTLVGYTGATVPTTISDASVVFSVVLSASAPNGSYDFVLDKPLDQPLSGEDSLNLVFDFTAKDFDGSTVTGSFTVTDTDDTPALVGGAADLAATVNEGGLTSPPDPNGVGNEPASATTSGGIAGSLDTLVHFGADGPNATPFQFVANAGTVLTGLGIESHGATVNFASVTTDASGTTLAAYTGGSTAGTEIFTLRLNDDGSWNLTLLAPIDHNGPQTFDLSGLVQAVDFDGDTVGLSAGELQVTITDDTPVDVVGASVAATVNEGGLAATDPFGTGNEPTSATTSGGLAGSLDTLVHFGADGPSATPFQFVSNASTVLGGLGITSHGAAVDFAVVKTAGGSTELEAFTGGSASGTQVFTLTLNSDGSWSVQLLAPIDHNGPQTFDLSGLVQAVDFDGSTVGLAAGELQVTITDDTPVDVAGATGLTGTVNEGGLTGATDPNGVGNEPASATTFTGTVGSLDTLVQFGADGANATPFQFAANASSVLAGLGLTSHTVAVDTAQVSGSTLEAFAGTTEVFTLTVNNDGSWNVTLLAPIDFNGSKTIDLSGLVQAVDFDGSTTTLAAGDLQVTITDDTPVLVAGATGFIGTVNEGGLTGATDPNGTGNEPSSATTFAGTVGSLDTLVHFGADGPSAQPFQFVSNVTSVLSGLGIMSHGNLVNFAALNAFGSGVEIDAYTGGSTAGTKVFTLAIDNDGSWNVTLWSSIDHNGPTTIDLSSLVQAVDFDGSATTLAAGDLQVTVTDDAPVANGSGQFAPIEEGPLESGHPDVAFQTITWPAGALNSLTSFGADGPAATAFTPVDKAAGDAFLTSLHLTSNGVAVDHTVVTGTSLVAADANNNVVFTLTVGGDGSYSFEVNAPIDQAAVNSQFNLDISGFIQAIDFDGSATALSGDVTVVVRDDRPVVANEHASVNEYTPDPPSLNTPGTQTSVPITLSETDNAPGVTATFTVTSLPANGTLYLGDGVTPVVAGTAYAATGGTLDLVFKPAAFFAGETTFQFTSTDSNGATSPSAATATIDVAPVADPPVIASVTQADFSPADTSPPAFTQLVTLTGGGYVESWQSNGNLFAQTFDAGGHALTSPVTVGDAAGPAAFNLTVALTGGGYAIVWNNSIGQLVEQAYHADGTPNGTTHIVETAAPTNVSFAAQVNATTDGGFAVLYERNDSGQENVYTQVFGADGTPSAPGEQPVNNTPRAGDTGDEIVAETNTFPTPEPTQMATLPNGYAVTWSAHVDGQQVLLVRVFDNNGDAVTPEIQLGTPPAGGNDAGFLGPLTPGGSGALITPLANGDFAVAWMRQVPGFPSGSTEMLTKVFHASDNYVGEPTVVVSTSSAQDDPLQIEGLSTGGYVVMWQQGADTYVQVYDANGHLADNNPADSNGILVDTGASAVGGTLAEQILALADGRFAVMWGAGNNDTFVRVFSADGTPVSDAQQVGGVATTSEGFEGVQMIKFADGTFAVVYDHFIGDGAGGNQDHLTVQQFGADGMAIGNPLELVASPSGSVPGEFSDFLEFRVALSDEGLLVAGGTTGDNGVTAVNIGIGDTAIGTENTPIALFNASIPPDPSETLKITITGYPPGTTFTANGVTIGADDGHGNWVIDNAAALATERLTLVPPAGFTGTFALSIDAQSIDTATLSTGTSTSTADTLKTVAVTVTDANDVTLHNPSSVSTLAGGGPIALGISAPVDADNGNDLKITVTAVPQYGTVQYTDANSVVQTAVDGTVLTAAELTTLTFSAPLGTAASSGDNLVYEVQDGPNSIVGTIALSVAAGADAPVVTNVEPAGISGTDTFQGFDLHQVALAGGGFVEVWTATTFVNPSDHTQDVQTVFAQLMDANGKPAGSPIAVGTNTGDIVTVPPGFITAEGDPLNLVVALKGGGFAVSWVNGSDLFVQAYNANGTPNGSTEKVDTGGGINNLAVQLNATSDGGFAVLYERNDGTEHVYTQVFSANGTPSAAGEQHVNNAPFGVTDGGDFVGGAFGPDANAEPNQIATLPNGYAVMWNSFRDGVEVNFVRVFNNDGTPATGEIQVSTPPSGANDVGFDGNIGGIITALANGDFAVSWTREQPDGSSDVMTKIFHAADNYADTQEVTTSSGSVGHTGDLQTEQVMQVAALATGGYAVLWSQSDNTSGATDAFIQVYDANGHLTNSANAGGILVDGSGTAFPQQVLALADGDLAVMWTAGGLNPNNTFVSVYNPEGGIVAGPTQVNHDAATSTTNYSGEQMIAFGDGGFAVIYDQTVTSGSGATHTSQDHLFAQQYDAAGNAVGGPLALASSPFTGASLPEFSDFTDFRAALSDEGLLLSGGTTTDNGTKAITLEADHTMVGPENTPIALVNISVPSPATETLTVTLSGFPSGATFEANGTPVGHAGAGNTWVITDPVQVALLATDPLTIIPPTGFSGGFQLTVDALDTKTVGAQTSTAETIKTYEVSFTDANDVALSNPSAIAVQSGAAPVTLNIGAPVDADSGSGDTLIITIQAVPAYGALQLAHDPGFGPIVDGTTLTAAQLQDLEYVPPASGSFHGDSLVYSVQDGASLVDGTIAITVSDPNGGLYFSADDPDLFVLDSHGNLTPIPVNPGNPNGSFAGEDGGFISFANGLYFNADTNATGEALFRLGADNVAHPVTDANGHDIQALIGISADFTIYDNSLYFIALGNGGTDLFKIDPTGAVTELNVNPGHFAFNQFNEFGLAQFDGKLYFDAYSTASTNFDQTALFVIGPNDGSPTQVEYNGQSLDEAGEDGGFFTFSGGLFFNAFDPTYLDSLFVLDANGQPTLVMSNGFPLPHVTGETTYFQTFDGNLYVTEQSSSGSNDALFQISPSGDAQEVTYNGDSLDFSSSISIGGLGGLVTLGNSLFFSAETTTTDGVLDTHGGFNPNPVLFQIDSHGNVAPVTDGSGNYLIDAGEDAGFASFNGHLYFFADDATPPSATTGLFETDGSGIATQILDPTSGGSFTPADAHFTQFDGSLYFEAGTSKGFELVQIDSTNTAHVIDINPTGSSFPGENGGFGVYTPIATAFGTDGNDTLSGGANTVFIGGKGNDTITGAGTNDTAVIDANFGDPSTHVSLNGGVVTVTYTSGVNTYTDTLTGIDRIQFADKGLLIVDQNGDFGYSSVQAAVNAATQGDTIWVLPGTYTETDTPLPYSATPGGLFVDTPNLTIEGVTDTGASFGSVTDANKGALPTIISGAQTDFGSNIFIGPNADNTVLEGLHLQAGPETSNKLLEIWATNVTVDNNFIDTFFNGTDTQAAAIYLNGNGSTFSHELGSYDIADNILDNSIVVSNGVGNDVVGAPGAAAIGTDQIITGNTFEGVYVPNTGSTSYDTILVQGEVPGIGWLLAPAQIPTATGNTLDGNTRPFLLRGSDIYGSAPGDATPPSPTDIADFIASNTSAGTTYAYVLDDPSTLHLTDRGTFESFYVTNGIATLDAGQNGTDPFGSARDMMDPGDTIIVQETGTQDIIVNNLTVDPSVNSNGINLTLDPALSTVTQITVGDYAPGQGADVTVTANNFGDTVITNDGNDTLTGGTGIDTAQYNQALSISDFTFSSNAWHVAKTSGATDTISGFEKVTDSSGHNFLLVGGGSQYTTIQEAVNAAHDGDTILLAPGTYTENVNIDGKAVNIEGFGGANGVGGATLDGSITESGTLDQNMTIEGLIINAAGQQNGISLTPTLTGPETVTVNNVAISGASETGFAVNGGGTNLTVDTTNSSFSGNGIAKTFGGSGDIDFFEFLGNAAFTNVAVIGTAQGTSLANSGDNGIQIAGFDEATKDVTNPLGNVTFDNVSVTGTYAKNLVYIQGYDDASNLAFAGPGLTLGNATTQTGWTAMFVDLGPQGGTYTPDPTQPTNVDLAGVTLAGWSFVPGNATFAPLAAAGLDDVIVGTPTTTDITGTSGNDAIIYNQIVGGVEHVDGGAGTDAEIINGTAAASTYNINPTDATHLGIEILPGANNTDTATAANSAVTTTNVEEIVLNLGNGGDTVNLTGDLHGVGVATNTVTINGGTGNDTVDASGLTDNISGAPVDVVFNGGGGNDMFHSGPGNDTFTDTGKGTAVYSETLQSSEFAYSGGHWTVTTTGGEGTDTLQGVSNVQDGNTGHQFLLVSADSQYTTIQEAVNAASDGDTILVAPGTYTENVDVNGKALNFEGFGGANGVGGAVLDGSISQTGTLDHNMTIEGFTINATGSQFGVELTPTVVGSETVTLNNDSISGASQTGFLLTGGGTNLTVDTTNSSFSGSGFAKTSGGSGDIDLFEFLGNAAFTNVQVTGVAQGTPLANAGDNGIQIAGFDEATKDVTNPLGNVTFDNVDVTGTYAKNLVYIQGYDSASGLTFTGGGLTLGNATTQTGWTSMFVDLSPQGGTYTPSATPSTLDLANVDVAGWSFVPGDAVFAELNALGAQTLIVGAAGVSNVITGTTGNDAIIYNQAEGGTETVDGGAGTDTEIINGTNAVETFNINPTDATHLGIEILPGANNTDTATAANSAVTTTNVEEIVLNLGNGGDTVNLTGDLHGVGVATNTVTINGGTGNDTVDASGLTDNISGAPVDVVFNGGGGNDVFHSGPGNDAFTDTGNGQAIYKETLSTGEFSYASGKWTVTTSSEGTDTLQGVDKVTDGTGHNYLLVSADSQYTTLQEAIDASHTGDTILVAPGTYTGQYIVDPTQNHGADGISIVGLGDVTIDAPSSLVSNGNSPTSGRDIDGLLTVSNASNVSIENIDFNGLQEGAGATGANAPTLVGVAYLNASGTVDHADITGIRDDTADFGDQQGIGVYVSNTAPGAGPLNDFTLTNSTIEDWQKGAVVAANANVDIEHNVITGAGATDLIAQNGIELVGDTGTTSNNTINEIGYIPTDVTDTGILFWDSNNLTLDNNSITGALFNGELVSQTGIYGLNSSDITIHGNTISNVLEGIGAFEDGSGAYAGTFAPTWDIGPTNSVTNYTQYALDFEATDTSTNVQAAGNFMISGTNGNDFLLGGSGTFTAQYNTDTLTTASFKYDTVNKDWVLTTANEGTDTLQNVEVVTDENGHRFLLVGGGSNYTTIQDAVNAAQAGDTILIAPGTYTETSQYVPGNFQGLYINTPNLTLQGYSSLDGTAITTAAAAQLYGPTVIAGAQNDFGANDWIDQGGSGTTIEGLHLQAGGETDNKLIEITTDNVTIKNDFIDTFFNGSDSGAAAIYIDNQGTPINSYLIDHNILNEGIYVANGVGTAADGISTTQVISNNEFEGTFDPVSGNGRYDMVAVQGTIPGVPWQPDPAQVPTIEFNTVDNNESPFLFRMTEENTALFPTAAEIATFIGENTSASTTYAYVLNPDGSLHLIPRTDEPALYYELTVANSIDTLDAGFTAPNGIFGSDRDTMDPGDTIIVQGLSTSVEEIIVTGLTVDPTASSNGMTFDLGSGIATSLALGDYSTGLGASVTVDANNLGDTITTNDGSDTLTGGTGIDTAVYTQALTTSDFTFSSGAWHVAKTGGASDTLTGFEKVSDNASHEFLLVGGGSQYTTIQEAIDAAHTGDTILVAPGTYTEQDVIDPTNGHGADGISIVGIGNVTIDAPTTLVKTGTTPSGSHDVDGIFTVNNASGVTIENLTVNGLHFGDDSHFTAGQNNPELVGIAYLNSTGGTIDSDIVTGIRESDAGIGDQRNVAIFDLNGTSTSIPTSAQLATLNTITIENSTIADFQKGGIVITNANADVQNNTVTGVGTVDQAQNGIQISGSTGSVDNNTISNIGYVNSNFAATGVLAFDNNDLTIDGNSFTGSLDANNLVLASTVGIYVLDQDNGTIDGNAIHQAGTGIVAVSEGDGLTGTWEITGNTASDVPAGSQGIYFDPNPNGASTTSTFTVNGTDAGDVMATTAGTDNLTGGAGNDFFLVASGSYLTSGDSIDGGGGHNTILFTSTTAGDTLVVGTNVVNVQEVDLVDPSTFLPDAVSKIVDASADTNALTFVGNNAADTLTGGSGNDTFDFTAAQFHGFTQTVSDVAGTNTLAITDTTGSITIADGDFVDLSNVETLQIGSSGSATVTLGADASADVGGAGNLFTLDDSAGTGSLTLDGSGMTANLKVLLGIDGNDILTGGAGVNTYQFGTPPTNGNDQITNFTTGHDQIAVSAAGFQGGLTQGEDVTSVFNSSGDATFNPNNTERFHFDTTSHALYYSGDGTTAHEILLATVTNATIHANDIHVVA